MTFGRELVVLLTKPFMFNKSLVHVWRSCGGLKGQRPSKNILYWFIEGQTHFGKLNRCSNEFDPSMN